MSLNPVFSLTRNISKDRIVPDPTTLRPDNPNTFTGEQEKRTVYLPPSIALDKATLLSILHDHLVLAQAVWPDYTPVEYLHPALNTTILISRQDITTLTSLHDGVAILHVLEYGDSILISWTVRDSLIFTVPVFDSQIYAQLESLAGEFILKEAYTVRDRGSCGG